MFTPASWWLQLAGKVRGRMVTSAKRGMLPLGISKYKSALYVAMKSRGMKRLTTKKGNKTKNGKKIDAYAGQSTNTFTESVNMTLTGRLWAGFQPKRSTHNSFELEFNPIDGEKIVGNANIDPIRDIVTLSEENKNFIIDEYAGQIEKNIADFCRSDIILTVSKLSL